ncbi:hypothetical protein BC829DRAFT_293486 [Chytridium lagenaria]|nr:hypothetical protein BC829DRAFT_293486 [Chytridium lagenaria]
MDEELSAALRQFGGIVREHDVNNLTLIHKTGVVHSLIRINDYFRNRGILASAFRHKGYPDLLQLLQFLLIYAKEDEPVVASIKTAFLVEPSTNSPPPDLSESSSINSLHRGIHALCRYRYIHLSMASPDLFEIPRPVTTLFDKEATPGFEHVKPALDKLEGEWTGNLAPGLNMTMTLKWGEKDETTKSRRFFGEGVGSDERAFTLAASVNLETGIINNALVMYQLLEGHLFQGCLLEFGIVGSLGWRLTPTPFWWRRTQE